MGFPGQLLGRLTLSRFDSRFNWSLHLHGLWFVGICLGRQNIPGCFKPQGIFLKRKAYRTGFWRGNVPALLMAMPYTAIQFTVLHKLKTFAAGSSKTEDHAHLSPFLSYISGALAGCAATVGSYPFDLLRTLLASQGEPKMLNQFRSSSPDLYSTDNSLTSFQLSLCGLAAGTCAKLVCHPLDVVKKRSQIEGLQRHPRYGARIEHRAYSNMVDALRRIVQKEGWAGLYKGIVPSTVKAAPAGAVTFVAYEYTSDWLESRIT